MEKLKYLVVFFLIEITFAQINTGELKFLELNNYLHSQEEEKFLEVLEKNPHMVNLPTVNIDNIDSKNKSRYLEMEKLFTNLDRITVGRRWTVLHWAAFYNLENLVTPILSRGAQINYLDLYQRNAAHISARWADIELTKLLLVSGIKLNQQDFHGDTALHILARRKLDAERKIEMMRIFFRSHAVFKKNRRDLSVLNIIVKKNELSVFNYLIKSFPKLLRERDREGNYALHWAAGSSNEKMFLTTLKSFNNIVNLKNSQGWTAVHWAVKNNNTKVLEVISRIRRANFEAKSVKGNTPLHIAVMDNRTEHVKILLKRGVYLNVQNSSGNTPLHIIAQNDFILLGKVFMALKARKNIRNKKKQLPIDLARSEAMKKILS